MFEEDIGAYKLAKLARDIHWQRLRQARLDCPTGEYFAHWLEHKYGLRMTITEEYMISGEYVVVDESKYTMYLLKYSQ